MSFWTENDILQYIHENNLPIAEAYGKVIIDNGANQLEGQYSINEYLSDFRGCKFKTTGCTRTGCVFCMFGITQDLGRFKLLKEQEPALYDYVMRGGEFVDGIWQPTKDGLGYDYVIDWLNEHGNLGIEK